MNLVAVLCPIVYLYLTSRILGERFVQTISRLKESATSKPLDFAKLDEYLLDFNRIVDDLQKCYRFWSQILSKQYLMAISCCSVVCLVCR